jgi:Asp-tRNA(Asn)/Glu-tRNA(Gln) amidotransferase A subunit family amidase
MTGPREQATAAVLARIARDDPRLLAMTSVDRAGALGAARARDAAGGTAPLDGVCVAVKDIIDVVGMPTRAGSSTREHATAAVADADVVARLRAAGAIVVGKTTTTELAAMDPTVTRNPWDLRATPGGSSSGSAAIVGSGAVPLAVGTQTAGSLCRPASYCGTAAVKPSWGLLPLDGIVPLAPSFDTVGLLARTVREVSVAFAAIGGPAPEPGRTWTLGLDDVTALPGVTDEAAAQHAEVATAAKRLGIITTAVPPLPCADRVIALHRTVMAAEAYQHHAAVAQDPRLGPLIRGLLAEGRDVSAAHLTAADAELDELRAARWRALDGVDAVLTLAVPGAAPASLDTTGPAGLLIPWSAFRGPLAVLPGRLDNRGLPLATMLAGAPGRDGVVLGIAAALAHTVDRLPVCHV